MTRQVRRGGLSSLRCETGASVGQVGAGAADPLSNAEEAIERQCRTCGAAFAIDADERRYISEQAARHGDDGWRWQLPAMCVDCRDARRRSWRPVVDDRTTEWRVCVECGESFQFGGRDRTYFASRGWVTPRRCRSCRAARSVLV